MTFRAMLPARAAGVLIGLAVAAGQVSSQGNPTRAAAEESLPGAVNYSRVEATVACGGATETGALPELKNRGFNAVINLRQAQEPGADIENAKRVAEQAGLRYIHLPMNGADPRPETADAFLAALQDPAHSPVYIHCGTANRVGALWLIKRVLMDGSDEERATAEAERIGLRSPQLKQFALEYIRARRD